MCANPIPSLAAALALLCASLVFNYGAQASVGSESQEYFQDAQSALRTGDNNAAIIQLKNAVKSDLNNVAARYQLALLYLETGEGPSAEKELKAARQRGLAPEQVILPLAQAYLIQNKSKALLEEPIPQTVSEETRANLLILRAQAQIMNKDLGKAEQEINASLAITKTLPDAYLVLSTIQERRGDMAGAEKNADRALQLKPDAPSTLYRAAELKRIQGDAQAALKLYSKVIEINPMHQRARLGRALVSIGLGDDEQADEDIEAIFEVDPDNFMAKYVRALLLTRQKKPQQALELLRSARDVELYPPALYLFGSLYLATGKIETARDYFERFLTILPDNAAGNISLAAIELKSKHPEKAIKILTPLQQKYENNFQIVTLLANAYVAAGRFKDAAPLYDKASRLDPENDQLKFLLARSQFSSGAADQALSVLQSMIKQKPDSTAARIMLITGYMSNDEFDEARSAVDKLKKHLPGNGLPYYFYAAIDLLNNDRATAKQELEQALTVQKDFSPARISLARIALGENNPDEARRQYTEILKRDPDHLQALVGLAQLARAGGEFDKALDLLETASRKNPGKISPLLLQIDILLQQHKVERALVEARALVGLAPNSGDVLDALASAQLANGETVSAISTYRNLTTLEKNSPRAYVRLGQALTLAGNEAEASKAFDAAIKIDPNNMIARTERVNSEQRLNGPEAAKTLALAMRHDIKNPLDADLLVANTLYESKNYAEALALYQKAWADRKERGILIQLYRTLDAMNKRDDGISLIQSWLSDHPDDAVIRFLLSNARIKNRDYAAAISEAEHSLKKAPRNPAVLNNLAWLYHQQGNLDKALQYAEQAYLEQPKSPEIADTLGWLLMSKNKTARGLKLLRDANEKRPEDSEIGYHYAVALNSVGQPAKAKEILEAVLARNNNFNGQQEAQELYESLN